MNALSKLITERQFALMLARDLESRSGVESEKADNKKRAASLREYAADIERAIEKLNGN
jgi:hypothetical protein